MSKQTINLGTAPTGVGGDTPRSAFTKTQANFDELYAALGGNTPVAAQPQDATLTSLAGQGFVKKFSDNSQLTTTGWRRMPDGGIEQWGLVGLSAVGAFNPQVIAGITWYTHFYLVNLPVSYTTTHFSAMATIAGAPNYAQSPMLQALVMTDKRTASAVESLNAFTVSICTPATGWIPYINFRSCGK